MPQASPRAPRGTSAQGPARHSRGVRRSHRGSARTALALSLPGTAFGNRAPTRRFSLASGRSTTHMPGGTFASRIATLWARIIHDLGEKFLAFPDFCVAWHMWCGFEIPTLPVDFVT
jgi:hypothetical protein